MSRPADDNLLGSVGWECVAITPGEVQRPAELDNALAWLTARVPGTAADAVRSAFGVTAVRSLDVAGSDWWYRTVLPITPAAATLIFEGLATIADVWVDDELILHTENMFRSYRVDLPPSSVERVLVIRFAALAPLLAVRRRPRPRWRAGLVEQQNLRWYRTSLLGWMPAFAGDAPAVGPWRSVRLVRTAPTLLSHHVVAELSDRGVRVRVTARISAPVQQAQLALAGRTLPAETTADGTTLTASFDFTELGLWWPHTHGQPERHELRVSAAGIDLGTVHVGVRTVSVDRDGGGFALSINGVSIFVRGACWVPIDPISLRNDPGVLREALQQVVTAGLNAVRVTGTMVPEDESFYVLCDELGILVWHDCMLATLDPPTDELFVDELSAEVRELAYRLGGHPCIGVISGGSESEQQPAMLGLTAEVSVIDAIQTLIPSIFAEVVPELPYLSSSPSGGSLPFSVGTGVTHYFGVGGYLRPLSDARSAGVRFAAECLAFGGPPERDVVEAIFGSASVAGHDPEWKRGIPRDRGSSWDFEDVRDHYVREIFGVDPFGVRRGNPERYLDLGRAAVAHAMTETFRQWRRPGSTCAGGLILALRDLVPGAGWGLVDSTGRPKASLYALRDVLAPFALFVTDEGLDGLLLNLVNDSENAVNGRMHLDIFAPNAQLVDAVEVDLAVPARSAQTHSVNTVLGRFNDTNNAYGFGPPAVDVLSASLVDTDGVQRARTVHFALGQRRPIEAGLELRAETGADAAGQFVLVSTGRAAQWVALDLRHGVAHDSWFHLAPGQTRRINIDGADGEPLRGTVRALNAATEVSITQLP